jgi:hypothetical protein
MTAGEYTGTRWTMSILCLEWDSEKANGAALLVGSPVFFQVLGVFNPMVFTYPLRWGKAAHTRFWFSIPRMRTSKLIATRTTKYVKRVI